MSLSNTGGLSFAHKERDMKAEIMRQEEFEGVMLSVIEQDGQEWFLAEDLGKGMGFKEPRKSINKIFNRSRDEFEGNTRVVNLATGAKTGNLPPLRPRVFNAEAAVILAMKAGTPRAKKFRRWVSVFLTSGVEKLKVHILKLEAQNRQLAGGQKLLPAPEHKQQRRFIDLQEDLRQTREATDSLLAGKNRTIDKLNRQLEKAQFTHALKIDLELRLLKIVETITALQTMLLRLHGQLQER
jgi:prophage antirepressor-like protein